jgi:hypothetical protein
MDAVKAMAASQESADYIMGQCVGALHHVSMALFSSMNTGDVEAFEALAEASEILIDVIGYSRNLFGGPKANG